EILGMTAQLGRRIPGQHVPGLKLRTPVLLRGGRQIGTRAWGKNMDDRLGIREPRSRIYGPYGFARSNGRPDELLFDLGIAPFDERMKQSLAYSPYHEVHLIHRRIEWNLAGLFAHKPRHRCTIFSEAFDESRGKQIDAVRPTVMTKVPYNLNPGVQGPREHRRKGGEIVLSRAAVDQVPARSIARCPDPEVRQNPVILRRADIMLRPRDHVEPIGEIVLSRAAVDQVPARSIARCPDPEVRQN